MAKKAATPAVVEPSPRKQLSDGHLEALALGREQSRVVRRYLEALDSDRPRNGRHSDPEFLRRKLERLDRTIPDMDVLSKLQLIQQRLDTVRELEAAEAPGVDLEDLEAEFIKAAKAYSERKNISWSAWRTAGVAPDVLRKAGIRRTQS